MGNLRPREMKWDRPSTLAGFLKGERLWACDERKANFFFLETAKFSEKLPLNGKKIRPAKVCGPTFQLMTAFLLPCECSTDVVVTAGQAGGTVTCPQCGRTLAVPKLRDLGQLRQDVHGETLSGTAWRPAHAIALLGALVAAASWVGGLWLGSGSAVAIDEARLRATVLSVDDVAIYKVWSDGLSRAGVRRPPADEEQVLLRRARFADGIRTMLHIVAAGAALASGAAAMTLFGPTRPSSGGDGSSASRRTQP